MAVVKEFKALFTISDQCSKPLKELKKSFASFAKTAENFRKNATQLGAVTLAPLAGALTAVTASVKNSITAFIDYGTGLSDVSSKLGITSNQLVAMQHAAEMAGSSAETMNAGLSTFSKNLAEAGQGKNQKLAEMMDYLGISMRDANGNMRTAADLMPELADAIARQHTQAQKAYIANTALGKAGQELIQCMDGGADAFKQAADEAARLGLMMDEDTKVGELDDSMKLFEKSVLGVQIAIGEKLAPVLSPIFTAMTDWVAANREWIAQEMSALVQDLAASLKEIDFKAIISGMTSFIRSTVELFKNLGGLKTVGVIVAGLFAGKFLSSALGVISSFGQMAMAFKTLVPILIGGIKAVGVAFLTNPIGLVITAICAAVGLLIAYWDDIVPFFESLWKKVKEIFSAVADNLTSVLSTLMDAFSNVFFGPFKAGWALFESLFPDAAASIEAALEPLVQWFGNLWESIKAAFFDNFTAAFDAVKNAASWVGDKFSNAWDATKNFFSGDEGENANAPAATPITSPMQSNALSPVTTNNKLEISVRTDQNSTAEVTNQKADPGMKMNTTTNNGRLR